MAHLDPHHVLQGWVEDLDPPPLWVSRKTTLNCGGCNTLLASASTHVVCPVSEHCRLCGQLFCSACLVRRYLPTRFEKKGYRIETTPSKLESIGFIFPSAVCKRCDEWVQERKRAIIAEIAALECKSPYDFVDIMIKDIDTNNLLQLFPCWEKTSPADTVVTEFYKSFPDLGPVSWFFHGQAIAEQSFRNIPLAEIGDIVYVRCASTPRGEDVVILSTEERGSIGGPYREQRSDAVTCEWMEEAENPLSGDAPDTSQLAQKNDVTDLVTVSTFPNSSPYNPAKTLLPPPPSAAAPSSQSALKASDLAFAHRKVSVAAGGVVVEEEAPPAAPLQWLSALPTAPVPPPRAAFVISKKEQETEEPTSMSFRNNPKPGFPTYGEAPTYAAGPSYSNFNQPVPIAHAYTPTAAAVPPPSTAYKAASVPPPPTAYKAASVPPPPASFEDAYAPPPTPYKAASVPPPPPQTAAFVPPSKPAAFAPTPNTAAFIHSPYAAAAPVSKPAPIAAPSKPAAAAPAPKAAYPGLVYAHARAQEEARIQVNAYAPHPAQTYTPAYAQDYSQPYAHAYAHPAQHDFATKTQLPTQSAISAMYASTAHVDTTPSEQYDKSGQKSYVRAKYDYTSTKAGKYLSFVKGTVFRVSKPGDVWLWVAPLLDDGSEGKKGWVPRKYVAETAAPA